MKKSTLALLILLTVVLSGCTGAEKPIGGDTDEHGCLIAAGYSWCASKEKCLRTWEEPCPGMVRSFDECAALGYPVMESQPRQCTTPEGETFVEDIEPQKDELCTKKDTDISMTLDEAKEIAQSGECTKEGSLKGTYVCNEYTGTWWMDLDLEKEGCSPACVVNVETKESEINWRCTGLLR
ncbi:MAG: hypothetical protein ABIG84_05320 [archaeon]